MTSTSIFAHRPTTPGFTVSVSHQPAGASERFSTRASKSLRSDDSLTRSSLVKSVPIQGLSIIEGGTRIVRAMRGR